jgi:ABC-type molybdate transport system ATPase subunit
VFDVLNSGDVDLTFRRNFGSIKVEEWEKLTETIDGVILSSDKDKVAWVYEKIRIFSTASLYKELMFPGLNNRCVQR